MSADYWLDGVWATPRVFCYGKILSSNLVLASAVVNWEEAAFFSHHNAKTAPKQFAAVAVSMVEERLIKWVGIHLAEVVVRVIFAEGGLLFFAWCVYTH